MTAQYLHRNSGAPRRVPRAAPPAAVVVFAALLAGVAVPAGAGTPVAPPKPTGPFQLYCPHGLLGDLVLHAQSKGTISPSAPKPGQKFHLVRAQVVVSFPAKFASELEAFSPLHGQAAAALHLSGASPSARAQTASFTIAVPTPVPAGGLRVGVPATPASYGPFTATSTRIVVREGNTITLTLEVRTSPTTAPLKVPLQCAAFPNSTPDFSPSSPWTGTGEPPLSAEISPVVAVAE